MKNIKYVMKNPKTGEYWCPRTFPPLSKDVWKAEKFDASLEAKASLNALLGERFNPKDFEVREVEITEK